MKKMMLLSFLSMIVITGTTLATETKSCTCSPTAVWIKLVINFHRPKLNCEGGFGLCFVVTWGFEEPGGSPDHKLCVAKGQYNDQNQFVLEVDEAVLAKYDDGSVLPYFKDKRSVSIMDPYTFPEATCRALGGATTLTIKPGTYPVSFQNGVYRVVFQL